MKRLRSRRPTHTDPQSVSEVVTNRMVATIPVLLTLKDISAIYRKSAKTIRNQLQAGTFRPVPWDNYPYRWLPTDVEKDFEKPRDLKMRNHGRWNGPRLKPAKVTSPHGRRNGKKTAGGSSRE